MPTYTRASRDYDFVPGIGSNLVISNYNDAGVLLTPGVILDIEQGFIRETWKNKDTTHSGSNGATLRTRTGYDWRFACVLSFPAQVEGGLATAFVQTLAASMRKIHIQFNIGDPMFWTARGLPPRSLRATKALLSECETRLDSRGDDVVGLNIAGEGSSLLWTYLAGVAQYPGVWF